MVQAKAATPYSLQPCSRARCEALCSQIPEEDKPFDVIASRRQPMTAHSACRRIHHDPASGPPRPRPARTPPRCARTWRTTSASHDARPAPDQSWLRMAADAVLAPAPGNLTGPFGQSPLGGGRLRHRRRAALCPAGGPRLGWTPALLALSPLPSPGRASHEPTDSSRRRPAGRSRPGPWLHRPSADISQLQRHKLFRPGAALYPLHPPPP
ncbi:hypothetical protein DFH27DRAFT_580485, partial [Peziza echinospora]